MFASNTCMLPVVLCSNLLPSRLYSPRMINAISNPGLNVLLAVRGRFEAGSEDDAAASVMHIGTNPTCFLMRSMSAAEGLPHLRTWPSAMMFAC